MAVRCSAVSSGWVLAALLGGCAGSEPLEPDSEERRAMEPTEPSTDSMPDAPGMPAPAEPGPEKGERPSDGPPSGTASGPGDPLPQAGPATPDPDVITGGDPAQEPDAVNPLPEPSLEPAATWHADIAPLIVGKCSGCHREGGIGPFALETYEQARTLAPLLRAAMDLRIMPPWGAEETEECEPRFPFKDDVRLSDEELALFGSWVEADTPEGDPASAAPLPHPPSLELEDPGVSLSLPDVAVDSGADSFLCFSLDPGFTEDAWVTATQVVPGNTAIVHHVLTYLDTTGESAALAGESGFYDCFGGPGLSETTLLGAWAPGGVPFRAPEGVAMTIPAGSRLVVNVHYHPTGAGNEVDSGTRVDLALSADEPQYDGQIILLGNFSGPGTLGALLPGDGDPDSGPSFLIPAGATGHVETMTFSVPPFGVPEGIIWGIGTHMHYVGTDMRVTVRRSSPGDQPEQECLLQTPHWDFNWQRGYLYDAPLADLPTAGPGDVLEFRCTYDNSLDNPFVREALDEQGLTEPHDVHLGEESLDEMCLGAFAVAYPR